MKLSHRLVVNHIFVEVGATTIFSVMGAAERWQENDSATLNASAPSSPALAFSVCSQESDSASDFGLVERHVDYWEENESTLASRLAEPESVWIQHQTFATGLATVTDKARACPAFVWSAEQYQPGT